MSTCGLCGEQIEGAQRYCVNCGVDLSDGAVADPSAVTALLDLRPQAVADQGRDHARTSAPVPVNEGRRPRLAERWRSRSVLIGIAGVVLALFVGLGVWRVVDSGENHREQAQQAASPLPSDLAIEVAEVARVLRSLPVDPAAALAESSRSLVTDARAAISANAVVIPHPHTWQPGGDGGMITVTVEEPGRAPVLYAVIMVLEPGGWKVAATIAVGPPRPVET